jgi:hypothetical protein
MPEMVKVDVNPEYRPSVGEKAAFEAAKKAGIVEMPYVTAMENIVHSNGMYRLATVIEPDAAAKPRRLDEMPNDELKLMMLNLGIKTDKQMKRSDIIRLIQTRLDAVEVLDDDA